jgi:hypothetical protein
LLNLNFSCFTEQKATSEESSLFLFIHALGEQGHLSKTIAFTAEVNKNAIELKYKCGQNNAEYGAHLLASTDNLRKWDGEKERRQDRDLEVY